MLSSTSKIAILGFVVYANAHMMMSTPVPFGKSSLNNSPLAGDGSDFPCKQRAGVYDVQSASNNFALGSSQPLAFIGSATHGGGSCQISITYDSAPTKNSVWKVIHSIEGGCPIMGVAGNNGDNANSVDPSTYNFTIPSTIPSGSAVLAWTWFNKIGNREMYMNCAPVTLTGGSSKRASQVKRDAAAYSALPNMFVANIGNGCGTKDSTDLLFPDPGNSVEQDGLATSGSLSAPTGACQAAVVAASSPVPGNPAKTSAPVAPSPTVSGGVFVTAAPTEASPVATTAATTIPAVSNGSSPAQTTAAVPVASSASTPSTSGAGVLSGACTTEGEWNCVGGTAFQRCASGTWSVPMAVADGTTCGASGQVANIEIVAAAGAKRDARFSKAHLRRHLQGSF